MARALIGQPQLILADEPTGNLDSRQGEEVMQMLKELHEEGTTIIQVTHSELNARYAQRIVHLLDGRIEREEVVGWTTTERPLRRRHASAPMRWWAIRRS